MAKSADAKDLKSFIPEGVCGFKSRPGHHPNQLIEGNVGLHRAECCGSQEAENFTAPMFWTDSAVQSTAGQCTTLQTVAETAWYMPDMPFFISGGRKGWILLYSAADGRTLCSL